MSKIARVKFIRDKEPNIKALTAENKVLDGALYVATDTGTLWMGISSSSLIQIKDNINTNTTYNLTKSGSTITLRGSDGSTFNVTDSNTVYGNATASAAGLMSAADKAKLDGVAAGSNHVTVDAKLSADSTNPVQNKVIKSALDGKSNTGHKHVKADITDFPTSMPASDVSAWAKAATKPSYSKAEVGLGSVDNTADSAKSVKYATSAGSVAWSNVSDRPFSMPASDVYDWAKASSKPRYTISEVSGNLPASRISGTIAAGNLPSYVDDVLEYASLSKFPTAGESGKIYTALDTNKIYRWSGSAYVVISETIALGTTHSSAGYGDESRAAYNHSTKTSGNPHHVTKADVGLGSVDNTADSAKSVKYAASAGSASSATTAATANALKVTELTTQNLDDTKTVGLYFACGGNSVKNKPTGVDTFGLEVKRTAAGYLVQVLTEGNIKPMKTWIRQFNASAWSAWAHYFDSNHAPTWSEISGRPSIPSVGNGTVTITQNGATKGSFTLNQSGNATIALTDNNTVYSLPAATSSTLGGVKVGSNITNSSGTISLTKANVTSALGYTPPTSDTNTWRPEEVIISSTQPSASTCKLWIKI